MSSDQVRVFIERMKSDETFRNNVIAIKDVAVRFNLIKSEESTSEYGVPPSQENSASEIPEQ